jgi:hypothetical protein
MPGGRRRTSCPDFYPPTPGERAFSASLLDSYQRCGLSNVVYFVRCGSLIKIGEAKSLRSHLSQLQTDDPCEIWLIGIIPEGDEKEIHNRFRQFRFRGEWFLGAPVICKFVDENGWSDARPLSRVRAESGEQPALIVTSRQPFLDGAQALLARGYDPATPYNMRRANSDALSFVTTTIGHAAGLTVSEARSKRD